MSGQFDQVFKVAQSLSLTNPWVVALVAVALPLIILVPRTRLRGTARGQSALVYAVRFGVVALLLAALAEPTLRPPGTARAVVFALDVSDSVSSAQQSWAREWIAQATAALPPGSQAATIVFGARAQLDGGPPPPGSATDLAAALRLAGTVLPREPTLSPTIVLFSDGWPTATGSTTPADAVPAGVAVAYVPLPQPPEPRVALRSLSVPPVARVGDRIDLTLTMQASEAAQPQLRIWIDEVLVGDGPLALQAGEARLTIPQRLTNTGFATVRAEVALGEQRSTLSTLINSRPAGSVLVLEDEAGQADALTALLQRDGLQVDRRPSSSLPPSAAELGAFDSAILVNTPATSLSLDQQRTLVAYVQDLGRGLLVIGGPRTYAPGSYQGTALDDLLPVSAEPPIEPQQGSLALFLVLDRSGSMDVLSGGSTAQGGASKLAMAREAAIQAAGLLQPQDTLGVIAFDSAFQWVVPPTRLRGAEDVRAAQAEIANIKPGGGTTILPPLEAAFQAANDISAPLKHIVLLTDGESNDRGYEDLLARLGPARVTLSTLAIGSDADTRLLANLARLGGGRYYFTERSAQIPRIASKETTILTRNAVVDGRVAPIVNEPSPILRGLAGDLPALSGYVATTRKDRAVTALDTERGHPLLAHWQYGLGRVVAWTSDAQAAWTSEWTSWREAGQFWSQAVRWTLPAPIRADFQPTATVGSDGRAVSLQITSLRDDGRFADDLDTRAVVVGPDGVAREIVLSQRAPGTYGVETRASQPGLYRVLFRQGTREEVAGFSIPDAIEQHTLGANRPLLEQLARTTGGTALDDPSEIGRPGQGPRPPVPLWPWLLGLALLLLPLDVFLRRRV